MKEGDLAGTLQYPPDPGKNDLTDRLGQ